MSMFNQQKCVRCLLCVITVDMKGLSKTTDNVLGERE